MGCSMLSVATCLYGAQINVRCTMFNKIVAGADVTLLQGEFSVPYAAHDICNQREKLREQREHVMLVVRAYNSERLDKP